jgi:hypothetical protein
MALRIQHERMSGGDKIDDAGFYREWGITEQQPEARRPARSCCTRDR